MAARRIAVLLDFGCNVTVVSPACLPALEELAASGRIRWIRRGYQPGDCAGARIALIAADDPEVNRLAAEEARRAGALVNRADAPEDCDFYFPGIVTRGTPSSASPRPAGITGWPAACGKRLRRRSGRRTPFEREDNSMDKTLKIGTRDSALALAQAEILLGWLKRNRPGCPAELVPMKSTGDRRLDMPLYTGEARGIFTGELEAALLDGRIDLAVHSLKDMGAADDPRLPIVAYLKRADPRDALLLGGDGSLRRVGTSSKRRRYQLAALAPEAAAVPVRGNLATRFRKLEEGEYSALILAAAGLTRLGETGRISRYFSVDEMIPACGQGILAVQAREDFDRSLLEGLEDRDAAERGARRESLCPPAMGGGCSQPVGGYAELLGDRLRLRGYWYDEETGQARRGELEGPRELAAAVGKALARRLQGRTPGKVWLVGAGPGDEGLLTVKGRELLRRADAPWCMTGWWGRGCSPCRPPGRSFSMSASGRDAIPSRRTRSTPCSWIGRSTAGRSSASRGAILSSSGGAGRRRLPSRRWLFPLRWCRG